MLVVVLGVDDKVNVKMDCVTNTDMFVFIVMDEELFSDAARLHKSFAQNWFFDDLCLISIRLITSQKHQLHIPGFSYVDEACYVGDFLMVTERYVINRKQNDNINNLLPT